MVLFEVVFCLCVCVSLLSPFVRLSCITFGFIVFLCFLCMGAGCPILLKFDTLMQCGSAGAVDFFKSTYGQIQDGRRRPNLLRLSRYNSATICSISVKFGKEFGHVTADTLQTFTIKGSKIKTTA